MSLSLIGTLIVALATIGGSLWQVIQPHWPPLAAEMSQGAAVITTPLPTPTLSIVPSVEATNHDSQPLKPTVAGTKTPTPARATPSATPSPVAATLSAVGEPQEVAIEFVNLPREVSAGESFTITWRVVGPTGETGSAATLIATYKTATHENNSHSSVNSNTTNSFGSFTLPATFSSTYSFGSAPATINVTASAKINGTTLTEQRSIELHS